MSSWDPATLGEIADRSGGAIQTGPFGSQLHRSDYTDDKLVGVPLVMPKDMVDGRVDYTAIAWVAPSKAAEMERHSCRPGDLLLSRRGDLGRCVLIREADTGVLCGTGSLRVTLGGSDLDPCFLFFYFQTAVGRAELVGRAVGSTMPNINTAIVRSVSIPLPPLSTQRKIAAILSAYDELIENNNRRIKLLEEMAQRIYREWFVDFRYPGHENVPLVDSDLGLIPEGWAVKNAGEAISLIYGKALTADDRHAGNVTVYGSGGAIGSHDTSLSDGPGVVVGRKGNVGAVYWSDGPFFAIDTTYWVVSELPLSYCYFALRDMDFQDSHAAVPGLSRDQAYSLPLLVASPDVIVRFDESFRTIWALRSTLARALTSLRATRELLLPRLISGEIDVDGLDIAMPDAAP